MDEPLNDAVRRFQRYGATTRVAVSERRDLALTLGLEQMIRETEAKVVVVDTMLEFFASVVENPFDPMSWLLPLLWLRGVAQRTGAAIVLLAHTTREGKRYADSRQIGAGVDQIVTMTTVETDPTLRKIESRGRVAYEKFRIRYVNEAYELEDAELPVSLRVYRAIEAAPDIGSNELRRRVGGKTADVDAARATSSRRAPLRTLAPPPAVAKAGATTTASCSPTKRADPGCPEIAGMVAGMVTIRVPSKTSRTF